MTKTPQRRSAREDGGTLHNAGVFVIARLGEGNGQAKMIVIAKPKQTKDQDKTKKPQGK